MPEHESWRPLPVAVQGVPNLLVSTTFTSDSYKIQITDLANVWIESMDRKPIVKRGFVEDTSIDPSDGPDQIRRMLDLIRAAFDTTDPEHHNTSMTLGQDDKAGEDSLVIHLTCILPKPLKPFKWPIHLAKCPPSSLTTQLVLPLIQAHHTRLREIDVLVTALKEKDTVINRLVDKLDATGVGLEYVFNSLSGKRRITREIAEEKVKGLAPFREAEFRSGTSDVQAGSDASDVLSLLDSAFGGTGLKYKSDLDLEASPLLSDWWTKLGKGKKVVFEDHAKHSADNVPSSLPPPETKKGDDEEDDFQVQATPPGLAARRKRPSPPPAGAGDDDETTDGESEQEIPDSVPLPPKSSAHKPAASRLGTIGGHKIVQSSESPPPPAQGSNNDDSDTASDMDDEVADPSPPKPARRGGLGRIGGKARAATPPEPSRSPSPAAEEKQAATPGRRHKLGLIGRKGPAAEDVSSHPDSGSEDEGRGRATKPSPAAKKKEPPRETSTERADRKRRELEEEIRKKAAGPAKKKRKF
ncbi:XLF (XRCC4-like factor) domain containing protein [Naviculisporaceae sp. PSN 640]